MNAARHNGKGQTRTPQRGRPDGHGDGPAGANAHAAPPPGTSERRPMPATLDHPAVGQDPRTDEQLLEAYRQGDRASFAALVARYQRELFHFLVRFLGDRAAAEDVFQESFLQVHQSADQFDPSRRFRPWLFTIAANKARDLIRSQARRPTNPLQASINPGDDESGEFLDLMSSVENTPDEPMQREELQRLVQKTVMGMPEHLREILLLSYFHQFPYKQISDILDIPLGTVKSRLHAAVAHFADRWKSTNQHKAVS
jgi:RNA polymerase sigma-70 factor (ECF subfamily)